MKSLEINFLIGVGALIISIIAGYFLNKQGAPYGAIGTNIHKFAALGAIVFLVLAVRKFATTTDPTTAMVVMIVVAGLFLVAALVTGGIISHQNTGEGILPKIHRITNIGCVFSLATMAYLYLK